MKTFKNFGGAIKELRKKHELTQSDLGKLCKTHSQFISNAERGLCGLPKACLKKIVKKYPEERLSLMNGLTEDAKINLNNYLKEVFY